VPETVASLRGELTLDSSSYKKGIDDAQKATRGFTSEADRATASCAAFMAAEARAAQQTELLGEALRQETAFLKDMAAAEARLTSIRQGESKAAQDVAAKYHELSAAQRQELVAAQSAIAAHEQQQKALAKLGAEAERMPQRLRMMGRAMNQVGREMTQTLTVPIVALGAGILKAGMDVDKGMDAIQLATGATGDRLKALETSFKAVGGSVPNTLAEVGQALGTVATRTGLTGPPLEALTKRLLTMQRIMGGDLAGTIQLSTRLFGDWGVKVGDQSKVLDLLGRAHQITGISIAKLSQQLVQFGAPLRTVGFSLEQSVALFGKWNKEGVNAEQVATSIRIAIGRMVKAGVKDVPGAFQEAIKAIQAAKTPADQLSLSFKLFGARAGTDMARAIKEGRFAIGDLVKSLQQGSGTILDAAKKTDDFGERFAVLRNKVELALNPLGSRLMDALDNLGKSLIANVPRLAALIDAFTRLSPAAQGAIIVLLGFVAAAGPALIAIGKLVQAWGALQVALQGAAAAGTLTSTIMTGGWIALAIAAIAGLAYAWNTDFLHIRTGIEKLGRLLADTFGPGLASIVKQAKQHWADLRDSVSDVAHHLFPQHTAPARPVLAAPGTTSLDAKLFGGSVMDDAAARARRIVASRVPVVGPTASRIGPSLGSASGGGNPPDWMTRLGKTGKSEQEKEAERIAKIFSQARRTALGQGREKGDFASAEQQAALKLYTKDFDDLSAAQKKVADQLARIVVEGEKAAAAQAKHRKELQEHTRQQKESVEHTARLLAQNKDLERQIAEGGMVSHGVAAQLPHPKADTGQRTVEQAAQVEHDRLVARLRELNKARSEARNAEEALRKLWAGPAKIADDPQLNALHARTKAASDAAAALRKYHADEKKAHEEGDKAFEEEARKRLHFGNLLLEQQQKEQEDLFALGGSTVMPKNALEALRMQAEKLRKELHNDEGFNNFDQGMKNLTASLHKQQNAAQKFARSFSEAFQQQFEGMFTHLMEHGFKGFFKSVIQGFTQMLQQIAAQILAAKLTDLIFGGANKDTGERAGGLIDVIAKIFSHGKAGGGSVMAGQPYMVGEKGQELFVPSSSGRIMSNAQLAGAGGNSTVNIHLHGITDYNSIKRNEGQLIGTMNRESERMRRRNGNG
jgi:phage-related minor tail protein